LGLASLTATIYNKPTEPRMETPATPSSRPPTLGSITSLVFLLPIMVCLHKAYTPDQSVHLDPTACGEVALVILATMCASIWYHERESMTRLRQLDHVLANCAFVIVLAVCTQFGGCHRRALVVLAALWSLLVCSTLHSVEPCALPGLALFIYFLLVWWQTRKRDRHRHPWWIAGVLCGALSAALYVQPDPESHAIWHITVAVAGVCLLYPATAPPPPPRTHVPGWAAKSVS
jgi:hypothetical protein